MAQASWVYSARTLKTKLATIPLITVARPLARSVAFEYLVGSPPGAPPGSGPDPLWPGGSKVYGQRFTPKGSFDTVYLAVSATTALMEVGAVFKAAGGLHLTGANPQVVVGVDGVVQNVLDTTDPAVQKALKTSTSELTGVWAYVPGGGVAPTQQLGAAAYASGRIHGILYTSAKDSPQHCLCVFPDRLVTGSEFLRVVDSSGNLVSELP